MRRRFVIGNQKYCDLFNALLQTIKEYGKNEPIETISMVLQDMEDMIQDRIARIPFGEIANDFSKKRPHKCMMEDSADESKPE